MTDLDDLTSVYSSQVHAVRTQITKFGEAYWDSMPNYRAGAVEEMIEALVPRVTAGQLRIADLTRAYLARCARELGWKLVVPPLDKTDILGARGVDPRTVYRRPAVDVYKALSDGKPVEQAVSEGRLRLTQLIGGDAQLAKVRASRQVMRAYPDTGSYYRARELRPLRRRIDAALLQGRSAPDPSGMRL